MTDLAKVLHDIESGAISDAVNGSPYDEEGHYVQIGMRELRAKLRRLGEFGDSRYLEAQTDVEELKELAQLLKKEVEILRSAMPYNILNGEKLKASLQGLKDTSASPACQLTKWR